MVEEAFHSGNSVTFIQNLPITCYVIVFTHAYVAEHN